MFPLKVVSDLLAENMLSYLQIIPLDYAAVFREKGTVLVWMAKCILS